MVEFDLSGMSYEDIRKRIEIDVENEEKSDYIKSTLAKVKASTESEATSLASSLRAINDAKKVCFDLFSKLRKVIVEDNLFGCKYGFQAGTLIGELLVKTENWNLPIYGEIQFNVTDPDTYEKLKLVLASAFGEGKRSTYGTEKIALEWNTPLSDLTNGEVKRIRWTSELSIKIVASPEAHGCKLVQTSVLVPAKTIEEHEEIVYKIECS